MPSSSASKYFEIPKYFLFSEKGIYSGSAAERDFNYKVVPDCPKEGDKLLKVYVWAGEICLDKAENVTEKTFPLSEEGHGEMLRWLEEQYLSRDEVMPEFRKRQAFAKKICEEYVSLEDYMEHR